MALLVNPFPVMVVFLPFYTSVPVSYILRRITQETDTRYKTLLYYSMTSNTNKEEPKSFRLVKGLSSSLFTLSAILAGLLFVFYQAPKKTSVELNAWLIYYNVALGIDMIVPPLLYLWVQFAIIRRVVKRNPKTSIKKSLLSYFANSYIRDIYVRYSFFSANCFRKGVIM